MFCVVTTVTWIENVFSTDKTGYVDIGHKLGDVFKLVFSSMVKIRFSVRFENCRSLCAVARVTLYQKILSTRLRGQNQLSVRSGTCATGKKKKKTQACRNTRVECLHASSARSFRRSSNLFTTEFDVHSESREMDRLWCRQYLRSTIRKHYARPHLGVSHSRSRAPLSQERFQLVMSRLASRSFALDHTQRCRKITLWSQ